MLSCGLNHSDMFRDLVKSSVPSFMHKKKTLAKNCIRLLHLVVKDIKTFLLNLLNNLIVYILRIAFNIICILR